MKGNEGDGGLGRAVPSWRHSQKTRKIPFFDVKCWDFDPLVAAPPEDPYAWLVPSTPVRDKLAFASALPRPQAPHAVRAACHRPTGVARAREGLKLQRRASLVAQWLRIRLPLQGTRVRALVREDPTCRGATKPVRHNY